MRPSHSGGYTLIEMLVGMVLVLLVFGVALNAFGRFTNGSGSVSARADAQSRQRAELDRMVQVLRNAGPAGTQTAAVVYAPNTNDITVSSTDWPGESNSTTQAHLVRYCLNTSTSTLYFDGLYAVTVPSANPGSACPSTTAGWTHRVVTASVANTTTNGIFTTDSATPANVRGIGIDLRLTAKAPSASHATRLRSGLVIRSRSNTTAAPTPPGSTEVSCGAGDLLTLTGGITDTDGSPLSVQFLTTTNVLLGRGTSIQLDSGTQTVRLKVTNALGLSSVVDRLVTCP